MIGAIRSYMSLLLFVVLYEIVLFSSRVVELVIVSSFMTSLRQWQADVFVKVPSCSTQEGKLGEMSLSRVVWRRELGGAIGDA